MAKQSLPSVDDAQTEKQRAPIAKPASAESVEAIKDADNYQYDLAAFRNVNANLPNDHRILMRDTLRHLQDTGESLNDGTAVTDKTKAVLWLLENSGITYRRN